MSTEDKPVEYRFAGYRLDPKKRTLHAPDGSAVALSYRAFDTLVVFADHPGQTLSKAFLMDTVWPRQIVDDNNLSQAIVNLRRALGDKQKDSDRLILTLPGKGYCFTADVEAVYPSSTTPAAEPAPHPRRWLGPALMALAAGMAGLVFTLVQLRDGNRLAPETGPATNATVAAPGLAAAYDAIPNSIAVLPFTHLDSGATDAGTPADREQHRVFAIALHDAIINQLAKVSSLNVIARNSVVSLAGQGMDLPELGRVLRVESVMTGTLLVAEESARVNLQLIEPATGVTFWSGSFEADTGNLGDMIGIQADIALQVASRLATEIDQSEREQITAIPTDSFDAYQFNQAARIALYRQDHRQNWRMARMAIEQDPDYYDALHTFASANIVLVSSPLEGYSGRDHADMVLETAEAMIRIDPGNTQGHALRALALGTRKEWDKVGPAIDELLGRNEPLEKLKFIAMLLLNFGDFDTAIRIYEKHLLTEPLDIFGRGFLMTALELTGQREKAREQHRLGEQLHPTWWGDNVNVLLSLGRDEPLLDVAQLEGISPGLRQALMSVGDRDSVRRAVWDYLARDRKIPAEALYFAALAASIDERNVALALMEATVEDAWTSLFWFWLPVFDEVRQEQEFRALLVKSGIVEYWNSNGWPQVCRPDGASFRCDWRAYP